MSKMASWGRTNVQMTSWTVRGKLSALLHLSTELHKKNVSFCSKKPIHIKQTVKARRKQGLYASITYNHSNSCVLHTGPHLTSCSPDTSPIFSGQENFFPPVILPCSPHPHNLVPRWDTTTHASIPAHFTFPKCKHNLPTLKQHISRHHCLLGKKERKGGRKKPTTCLPFQGRGVKCNYSPFICNYK